MKGRKTELESRSTQLRLALWEWKRIPDTMRPSLRALAQRLGTSHQLLGHYLAGLEGWLAIERYRGVQEQYDSVHARAEAEDRSLTPVEQERAFSLSLERARAMAMIAMLRVVKNIKENAKRGPLHPSEFKILGTYARAGVPGAEELLQRRDEIGVKPKKLFADIVRETPRLEGETPLSWGRRIWDECDKYDTNVPGVMSFELLERLSKSKPKTPKNNLPAHSTDNAKSFGSVSE